MILSSLLQRAAASSLDPDADLAQSGRDPRPELEGPQPHLYADEDLSVMPSMARGRAEPSGIVGELVEAGDVEARARLVRGLLHQIGFEWLGYGAVTFMAGRLWPLSFFTSYANSGWMRRYFAHRHDQVDTRPQDAPASSLPLVWDVEQLEAQLDRSDRPAQRRQFIEDLHASGIRSGLFLRLASPTHVNEHTLISLLSGMPGREWIDGGVTGRALLLSLSVHEYLSRHTRLPAAPAAARIELSQLSPTQQYILEHLLQGRSDKEIAYRLQLSSHTVDYHMRQLRRRFSARNRVQLVKAATQSQFGESNFGAVG